MPLLNMLAHKALRAIKLSAVRSDQTYEADRSAALRRRNVDLVIDVGANAGQYALDLRRRGYSGAIVSVEPLPEAFDSLSRALNADRDWHGVNAAAGAHKTRAAFNISADSVCSSLLEPSQTLLDAIPTAKTVRTIEVDVVRLDDLPLPAHRTCLLKLDVQGFEEEALAGAVRLMETVEVLELELSLKPSYASGYTLQRALPRLTASGFAITSIGRGVSDTTTGQLIDMDVLLERASR